MQITDNSNSFPAKEGYTRYRLKNEDYWSGRMSSSLLTTDQIQVMRFQGYIFEKDFSNIPNLEVKKPPKIKIKRLKKSELELDANYYLCPDKTCGLFYDEKFSTPPCEHYCPQKDKLEKMIVCPSCKEPMYLPGNHSSWERVQHAGCPSGHETLVWTRMSTKCQLIYQKPK